MYALEGLFIAFFKSDCPIFRKEVGSWLSGIAALFYFYGNITSLLIIWNIYSAFKHPFNKPSRNTIQLIVGFSISFCYGLGIFLLDKFKGDNSQQYINVISFTSMGKLIFDLILRGAVISLSLVVFILMRSAVHSYKGMKTVNNFMQSLIWFVFMLFILNAFYLCLVIVPMACKFKTDASYQIYLTFLGASPFMLVVPFIYSLVISKTKGK